MAPPLLPLTRLMVCSACSEHVKSSEDACPHCGAVLGTRHGLLARAAGVALAGVMLASCNDGKGGSGSQSGSSTGSDTDTDTASGTTAGPSTTTGGLSLSDSQGEAAYGVPTTDFTSGPEPDTTTGTSGPDTSGTTTDTSGSGSESSGTGGTSMTGGPEYGVPDTTGGPEPDYGVPGTT